MLLKLKTQTSATYWCTVGATFSSTLTTTAGFTQWCLKGRRSEVGLVTSDGLILMKKLLRLYETFSTLGQGNRLILSLSL